MDCDRGPTHLIVFAHMSARNSRKNTIVSDPIRFLGSQSMYKQCVSDLSPPPQRAWGMRPQHNMPGTELIMLVWGPTYIPYLENGTVDGPLNLMEEIILIHSPASSLDTTCNAQYIKINIYSLAHPS